MIYATGSIILSSLANSKLLLYTYFLHNNGPVYEAEKFGLRMEKLRLLAINDIPNNKRGTHPLTFQKSS